MLSKDVLLVLRWVVEEANIRFSRDMCEELPDDIAEIVDKHPEWCIEYHDWNGDPEVLFPGETMNQTSVVASWLRLQVERMLENVS